MKLTIDQGFQQFLALQQIDFALLLEEADIPNLLWKEELIVDEAQFFRLQSILAQHLSDEQMIALSDVSQIQLFMPAFFAALSASNGLQAFYRFAKYKALVGPVVVEIFEEEKTVTVHLSPQSTRYAFSYFSVVNELGILLSIIRTGTGKFVSPLRVTQPFELGEAIHRYFYTTIQIQEEITLTFALEDLELPFKTRNNTMWNMIQPELDRQLQILQQENAFLNTVHLELKQLIAGGEFSIETLAQKMGVSTRTLQRQFKEEHTTFKAELQAVQFQMAIFFAVKERLALEEIAYLVGYSEVSAFSRAFKKWSGKTLKQYLEAQS